MTPHHIGYLVKNIERAIHRFNALGYETVSDITYDKYRDIDICFLRNGPYLVELVMPCSENSVVYGLLKKSGCSPYHICYRVDNIDKEAAVLREQGYLPMGEIWPAPALHDSPAAFYFNRWLGIIELIAHD